LSAGSSVYVPAGRVAIGLALRLAGVGRGEKVLLPAYHCASMVDPLSCVSANPAFYALHEDLSVDLDDISRKIDDMTRVLLVVNYFGFPQDLVTLRRYCDDRGLVLIEDCAHSFFGEHRGRPLGSFGDYAISSLTKFFPVKEGGCLISADPKLRKLPQRGRGLIAGLRHGFSGMEDAVYHGRLAALRPALGLLERVRQTGPSHDSDSADSPSIGKLGMTEEFDDGWLNLRACGLSKWISRNVAMGRIVRKRRENFQRLLTYFEGHRGCRPLIVRLPEGVVPYMFPLWVDNLAAVFPSLEDRAVPMQRFGQFLWPGVNDDLCSTSIAFSKHLIQLPCHQDLHEDELEWTLDTVSSVITSHC